MCIRDRPVYRERVEAIAASDYEGFVTDGS